MKAYVKTVLTAAILAVIVPGALAQSAPRLVPFQGILSKSDGKPVSDGQYKIQFEMFDQPGGGDPVWSGEIHAVSVNGGLVNVLLGTKTPFADDFTFNQTLFLQMTVDVDGDNTITSADPPMLPRQSIIPVIFSQNSGRLEGNRWQDFFVDPGGGDPADNPSGARAKDAERFDGMDSTDIFVSPIDPQNPKVQHAATADGISADLDLGGDLTIAPPYALNFGATLRQMINLWSATYAIGVQTATLYFRSGQSFAWFKGGEHADTQGNPGQGGTLQMFLDEAGRLGIGEADPTARVDVTGGNTDSDSLRLRSGNGPHDTDFNQILFSWNGSDQYTHAIKTRHNADDGSANAIDFYVWDHSANAPDDVGTKLVMSLDDGRVGIGTDDPQAALDVHGDVNMHGSKPIVFKKCTSAGNVIDTGFDADEWRVGVVGFQALNGDIQENGVQSAIIQVYPYVGSISVGGTNRWLLFCDFASHGTHEHWNAWVIAVRTGMADRVGY